MSLRGPQPARPPDLPADGRRSDRGSGAMEDGGARSLDALARPYRPEFAEPAAGYGPAGIAPRGDAAPGARGGGVTLLVLGIGAAIGVLLAAAILSLDLAAGTSRPLLLIVALLAAFGPVLSALLALRLARALAAAGEQALGAAGSAEAAAEAANAAPEGLAVTDREGAPLFANRRMRRLAPGVMGPGIRLPDFFDGAEEPPPVPPGDGRAVVLVDGRAARLHEQALPHPQGRRLWRLEVEEGVPAAQLLRLLAALEGEPALALRLSLDDPAPEAAPKAAAGGGAIEWRQWSRREGGAAGRAAGFLLRRGAKPLWLVAEPRAAAEPSRPAAPQLSADLAASPVGAALLGPGGTVLAANAAFAGMTGWDEGGEAGDLEGLLAEGEREALAPLLAPAGAAQGPASATLRFRRHQDRSVQLYLSAFPEGAPQDRRLALLIDVTQQKGVEQQFAHGQKMQAIGQLAGGVAHDFNNLLTAMIGFCDLLLQRHPPTDQSFADVQQIKQNALRAAGLVRQLLAFSRRQTLRPRPLDVTDVLADLRHLLSRLIGERIRLKIVHGRDLGIVRVDRGQLEQVIINLAVNARDAMRDGGSLTIATATEEVAAPLDRGSDRIPPGRYVRVDVADTGPGVPAEHADKIFDPFFTTKKLGEGTGLGLSTVYGIIRQTGGFVFLDRNGPDGATFTILLPEAAPEARRAEAEAPVEEAAAQRDLTGRETLLLVEDEDAVRLFAARSLRNKGYTVMEAASGEAALELSRAFAGPIHALVTDVVMPNMDGPTLAQEILKDRPGLSVVFMSGYAEDAVRQTLSGGDLAGSFLQKPFTLNDLAVTVKAALAGAESSDWPSRG